MKQNKSNNILELFFNEGTKQWHFKEIVKKSKISEDRANYWLKKIVKEKVIKHIKPKGKMPYFIADFDGAIYKNKKKLFSLKKLYDVGFLNHLYSMKKAKAVIIFGSFVRSDWYSDSDIDLFIVGSDEEFNKGKFESLLGREIQVFTHKNKDKIKKIHSGLIHNVINGYFIKGKIQDIIEVKK